MGSRADAPTSELLEALAARGHALHASGDARAQRNDLAGAAHDYDEAIALLRQAGDRRAEGLARCDRGALRLRQGAYGDAISDHDEALALFGAEGDLPARAAAVRARGDARLAQGDRAGAARDYDEALALLHAIGDRSGEADARRARGDVRAVEGDLAGAARDYDESLALFRSEQDVAFPSSRRAGRDSTLPASTRFSDERERAPAEGSSATLGAPGRLSAPAVPIAMSAERSRDSEPPRSVRGSAAHARAWKARGDLRRRQRDLAGAARDYSSALALAQDAGDRVSQARVLRARGDLRFCQDNLAAAMRDYDRALALFQAAEDRAGQAGALKARADLRCKEGGLAAAARDYDEALSLFQATGERRGQADVLKARGDLRVRQDNLVDAARDYGQALTLLRAAEDRAGEGAVLKARGDLYRRQIELVMELVGPDAVDQDDVSRALRDYADGFALLEALSDRHGQACVQKSRGDLARARGALPEALSFYEDAQRRFEALGEATEQGGVLTAAELGGVLSEIARVHALAGRADEARATAEQALARLVRGVGAGSRALAEAVLAGRVTAAPGAGRGGAARR